MSRSKTIEDIAPDGFRERYDADTYEEALRAAERAGSTTPRDEMPRCPLCDSVKVVRKKPRWEQPQRRDEPHKCNRCSWHGDLDAPRLERFDWVGDGADLVDADERELLHPLAELDDETLTALAIRAYAPWREGGPSYRDIARVLPYSRQWVGERVRAWRDGEHRDLVADPTADEPDPFEWVDEPEPSPDPFEWVGSGADAVASPAAGD